MLTVHFAWHWARAAPATGPRPNHPLDGRRWHYDRYRSELVCASHWIEMGLSWAYSVVRRRALTHHLG